MDARIGFPPTSTKIGFVCDVGKIRNATQLLFSIGTSISKSTSFPSASISVRATDSPFTTTSTGTFHFLCAILVGHSRAILSWDISPPP